MTVWWTLIWIGLIVLGVVLTAGVWLFASQARLIFRPARLNGLPAYLEHYRDSEISFDRHGVRLQGWLLNPERSNLVIYYGGNAEEVSVNLRDFDAIQDYAVLLVNYRGYGLSGGRPTERHLLADALFVIDHVRQRLPGFSRVVLFGRSLGTAVGLYVARHRPVHAVILITPFDSIREVAQRYIPFLPVKWFVLHPFDSIMHSTDVQVPMLAIVAEKDEIVPAENTQRLIRHLGDRCRSVTILGAGHNNVHVFPQYRRHLLAFLEFCRKESTPEGGGQAASE